MAAKKKYSQREARIYRQILNYKKANIDIVREFEEETGLSFNKSIMDLIGKKRVLHANAARYQVGQAAKSLLSIVVRVDAPTLYGRLANLPIADKEYFFYDLFTLYEGTDFYDGGGHRLSEYMQNLKDAPRAYSELELDEISILLKKEFY